MTNNFFFLLLFIFYIHETTALLKCYTCSTTEDDTDTHCLDKLGSKEGDITECDKKYCIVVRVDYKDPRGKFSSISRNCVDKPAYTNEVIEDATHRIYYRACKSDLCNGGNGRTDDSSGETGVFGDKSTIYCPGTGSNNAAIVNTFLTINVISLVAIYYIK